MSVLLLPTPPAARSSDSREALQRAASLVQQGRLDEADREVQPALSDPQTRGAACSVLGTIRFQQQRIDEGVSLLQEAIKLEPRLIGAHLTLAQAYLVQSKPDRAIPLLQHVLELDPSNIAARMSLARAHSEKGNYQQSLKSAEPVLAALKESPDGLILLATDYTKTGNHAALSGLAEDWSRLSGVPPEWAMKFALQLAQGFAVDVEYWPTPDPSLAEGSREQILDAYRSLRDILFRKIKQRFPLMGAADV